MLQHSVLSHYGCLVGLGLKASMNEDSRYDRDPDIQTSPKASYYAIRGAGHTQRGGGDVGGYVKTYTRTQSHYFIVLDCDSFCTHRPTDRPIPDIYTEGTERGQLVLFVYIAKDTTRLVIIYVCSLHSLKWKSEFMWILLHPNTDASHNQPVVYRGGANILAVYL